MSGIRDDEIVFIGGDMNGHVGQNSDGFEKEHGGKGYGKRNTEGEMLLEFAMAMDLVVCNTFFVKQDTKKITYESGGNKTQIDYILVKRKDFSIVKDVTVINGEPCITQHKLLLCKIELSTTMHNRRKTKALDRCRLWKLKEKDISTEFREEVKKSADKRTEGNVDLVWKELKDCLTNAANKTCGRSRRKFQRRETWWWNNEVAEAVKNKRRLFRVAHQTKKTEDVAAYNKAKHDANIAVTQAKESECKRFGDMLNEEDSRQNIFKIVKKIKSQNSDVTESNCIKDKDGKIITDDDMIRQTWKEYFDKLLNEEFEWDKGCLSNTDTVCGPSELITPEEVKNAVSAMKLSKAAGPSGVVSEMLKAAGTDGVAWMTELFNKIIAEEKIPDEWKKSWMVTVYKGKGDALECGSFRGIKLLDHTMKVFERVIEKRIRDRVTLDQMQFGFQPGKGTMDAIFIVRQLQEKYLCKNKELWMAFVDLEKAFDRVPREVLWWSLRQVKVDEWLVKVIMSMYDNVTTAVKVNDKTSEEFEVKVGVHQGSVLSPLLFIIVLEALSNSFRCGLPWELLYADDLVLIAESEKSLLEKISKWKAGLEAKGLKVNIGKTKVLKCEVGSGLIEESGKWPCGICKKGVGKNSIRCTKCGKWIHKRCSKIKGKITTNEGFQCPKCTGLLKTQVSSDNKRSLQLDTGVEFECVDKFCYLGDMIGAGGGAELATRLRVRCAWNKFREILSILTSRGASLKLKGKLYKVYVQSVMVYGSETWAMKVEDMNRLQRVENIMVRWMCSVSLKKRIETEELRNRLGIASVDAVVRRERLRWFGHVERKSDNDWVKKCQKLEVDGKGKRGRKRKTWIECVNSDMKVLGLKVEETSDRLLWRQKIVGEPSKPCKHGKTDVKSK
jgi:hypothetical protein